MPALYLLPLLFLSTISVVSVSDAGYIGVNYGRVADNLPPASKVVQLLMARGVDKVKLYDADPAVLTALAHTNITVIVAIPNELLPAVAAQPARAAAWVRSNVAAHHPATRITAIAAGNEVFVANLTAHLVPAMRNLYSALTTLGLAGDIKVSSPVALTALRASYPPSAGEFRPDLVAAALRPMLDFLRRTRAPLMINAYPFFAYTAAAGKVPLDYALFRPNTGVADAGSGLRYYNLFNAQVDAVFAALSALGYDDVPIAVTETGWPSKGDANETGASAANAAAYNGGLVRHVLSGTGTPLRPKAELDVYIFALFNEDKKPGPTSERNYGLFYPSQISVYDIPLTADGREHKPADGGVISSGAGGSTPAPAAFDTWCVAKEGVGKEKLQAGLDYACGEGGADCRSIQPGASCYNPNTIEAHASYAFNSYYHKNGRGAGTCYFGGAARVISQPAAGKQLLGGGDGVGKCGVANSHWNGAKAAATVANVTPPVETPAKVEESGAGIVRSTVLVWAATVLVVSLVA